MGFGRGNCREHGAAALVTLVLAAVVSCSGQVRPVPSSDTTLRVGVARLSASTNPIGGLRQLAQNLSLEALARAGEDGRMQPSLAESWQLSDDGLILSVKLRSGVRFSDGSPLDATTAARILPDALRNFMEPLSDDMKDVQTSGTDTVRMRFRRSSLFHLDALEATISKPGSAVGIGTGPYGGAANSTTELRANPDYYLGRPTIDRITVSNYPSVRAAWAEALRGNLDMLYEVSPDALDSLERSKAISTFVYTRHYQHVIVLNSRSPALASRETRRALNMAVDRAKIVRDALRDHGVVSSGPVWPQHWALAPDAHRLRLNSVNENDLARLAATEKSGKIRFTCLVPPSDEQERIALEVKRQLAPLGIDMSVEGVSQEELFRRGRERDYEALLTEVVSGPTLVRPYIVWLSKSPYNWGKFGNPTVDAALERVRNATTDDMYREAVSGVQRAFMDDPPAVFLAWSVRARAVSTRFVMPPVESGRDILSTLRLWRPATGDLRASRN